MIMRMVKKQRATNDDRRRRGLLEKYEKEFEDFSFQPRLFWLSGLGR